MWAGRLRTRRERTVTYWEEFVETDEWYIKELVADVPPEELQAALIDEDFSEDVDMQSDAARSDDEGGETASDDDETESDVAESNDDVSYRGAGTDGESSESECSESGSEEEESSEGQ